MPGIIIGIILIIFVRTPKKEPIKQETDETPIIPENEDRISVVSAEKISPTFNGKLEIQMLEELNETSGCFLFIDRIKSTLNGLGNVIRLFLKPTLLLLCLASSIRNGAGYVWGYNYNFFYADLGQTPEQITYWLSWIPVSF
jgi:hypothetical protein